MPTCTNCGTNISQDEDEKFSGLCPFCYSRHLQKETPKAKNLVEQNTLGLKMEKKNKILLVMFVVGLVFVLIGGVGVSGGPLILTLGVIGILLIIISLGVKSKGVCCAACS